MLIGLTAIAAALGINCFLNPAPVYELPTRERGFWDYAYLRGDQYELHFTQAAIDQMPIWNRHGEPPISANTAMMLADKLRLERVRDKTLWDDDGVDRWELVAAELTPVGKDRWFWLIRFEYLEEGSGPGNTFLVAVLMDGTVIGQTRSQDP